MTKLHRARRDDSIDIHLAHQVETEGRHETSVHGNIFQDSSAVDLELGSALDLNGSTYDSRGGILRLGGQEPCGCAVDHERGAGVVDRHAIFNLDETARVDDGPQVCGPIRRDLGFFVGKPQ